MGARPVAGGVGAGCGAFSFVGLLIGVGLTVWLGSIVVGGIGGSGGEGAGKEASATALGRTTLSVDPSGPLADDTVARVHGTGFVATSAVRVSVCLAEEVGPIRRCADDGARVIHADVLGAIDTTVTIRAAVTVGARTVSCSGSNACILVARATTGPDRVATAPLLIRAAGSDGLPARTTSVPSG